MAARTERWQHWFAIPVVLAAVATIPVLVLEKQHLAAPLPTVVRVADWLIWGVFALEAVVLFALSQSRRAWLAGHLLDTAIVVLTFPLIPVALQGLRVLRLLRLLRLARMPPLAREFFSLGGLRYASFLALLAMLGGGVAFSDVERNVSVGNGIYWALSTMTTVGYGDLRPKTAAGKVVAGVVMIIGVAFFAMITGAIAQRFLAGEVREIEAEVEEVEELVLETGQVERGMRTEQGHILSEIHDLATRLQSLEEKLRGHLEPGPGQL